MPSGRDNIKIIINDGVDEIIKERCDSPKK